MSRITIIEFQDGTQKCVTHAINEADEAMVAYAEKNFGPAHRIKKLTLCTEDLLLLNEAPITTWLKTTKRLK